MNGYVCCGQMMVGDFNRDAFHCRTCDRVKSGLELLERSSQEDLAIGGTGACAICGKPVTYRQSHQDKVRLWASTGDLVFSHTACAAGNPDWTPPKCELPAESKEGRPICRTCGQPDVAHFMPGVCAKFDCAKKPLGVSND